ncbi:type II toxin-antitoxin system PemK/MazF family toxin [Phytoactinopolyspora mesophila]|uniref:mRNA interferase n=1 Tax=Phytoactinopolyspora mesophila TaxID=2650750 RepID=A0A7K3LYI6_9ACTN|nr:type II toxin-antitoxin system PemK/MazF family toxin [Phytoactinopolyspora mesophila]NDL55742.1 type II toxin-antitoxin system PemK/MazF family toxin [Phytoactinopolyspora mesophila]
MLRGDIYLADLDPAQGSEADKRRPVVIVSNDGANTTASMMQRGVVTVVPVTSNVARVYPFQVLLPAAEVGLDRDSKAQAEQVRSITVSRLGEQVGLLTASLSEKLDDALRLHLSI